VSSVRLQGVRGELLRAVRKCVETRPGQRYRQDQVAADVRRIWLLGVIRRVFVEACEDGPAARVTYLVKSTRRIGKIRIHVQRSNHARWLPRPLPKPWRLWTGERLNRVKVREALQRLRKAYLARGFWSAQVKPYLQVKSIDQANLVIRVRTGSRLWVGAIRFNGNRAVSSLALRNVMQTRPLSVYDPGTLALDLMHLHTYYYDRGFVQVKLDTPRVAPGPQKRALHVSIGVREGKQFRMGKIVLRGEMLDPGTAGRSTILTDPRTPAYQRAHKRLKRLVHTRPGRIFNRSLLLQDFVRLIGWFKDRGYAYVNVVPITNVDVAGATVGIALVVTCGPLTRVEHVRVRGHRKVAEAVIRRIFGVAAGQKYNQQRILGGRRRLLGVRLFRKVDIVSLPGRASNLIRLVVEVTEN